MVAILKGIYRNGVIEPLEPIDVKEGEAVTIVVEDTLEFSEDMDVLLSLHRIGLINSFPDFTVKTLPEVQPIVVKGKPISETIIEERGVL